MVKRKDAQEEEKRNPDGCQGDGKTAEATCSPPSEQLPSELTAQTPFTAPAHCQAAGELGFPLRSGGDGTQKGTGSSLIAKVLHFPLDQGS